ncbi:MAG: hypothetical protein K2L04_06115 [Alistipes sp.]|nr:hypothetical protein [Alistipes sp.]
MNKHLIISLLAWCFAAVSLAACSDDEGLDPSAAKPVVAYPYDTLVADLNMVDNLPVIAVVKSETGLRSVSLSIRTAEGGEVPVTTVTEFFDRNSYSLAESIAYKADYVAAVVAAVDLLGRSAEAELPIEIVDIVEPPQIVFTPESWTYDETVGGDLPNTHFVVTSEVALKSIEMFRVSTEGQTQYGGTVTGGDTDPWVRYEFDALIAYGENDRGFRVRAVDSYDQVRIVSLPVKYKTVPPPTVTPATETIVAERDESKAVALDIESMAGVVKVELFLRKGKTVASEPVLTKTYAEKLNKLAFAEQIEFTDDVSGVRAVVTDNVGRSSTVDIKAIVGMEFVEDAIIGSIGFTDGNASQPGVYSLFSLKYMTTLPMTEVLDNATSTSADVDICYYNMSNKTFRIYSPDGEKKSEYKVADGRTLSNLPAAVLTRYQLRNDIDFDSATVATISEQVIAGQLTSSRIDANVGDVIAFKTGGKSSAGGNRVGILKVVNIVSYTTETGAAKDTQKSTVTVAIKFPKQ